MKATSTPALGAKTVLTSLASVQFVVTSVVSIGTFNRQRSRISVKGINHPQGFAEAIVVLLVKQKINLVATL